MVAYIGLDSLTDNMVASAIDSIFLSDLTAVAGDRYNFGENNQQGTADNDQQGCGIDKYQRRGAKNNCRSNE